MLFFLNGTYNRSFNLNKIESLSVLLNSLWWTRIISIIVKEVESNMSKNTLTINFRMGFLPSLCKKFVELVELLVSLQKKTNYICSLYSWLLLAFNHSIWKLEHSFLSQKDADPSKGGIVVVLLQDMLEVVTDMVVNEIRLVWHSDTELGIYYILLIW